MAKRDLDQLTALRRTRYLGSHPRSSGHAFRVDVIFTKQVIRFRQKKGTPIELAWSSIVALRAADQQTIEQNISSTDVMFLGPLALLSKDKTISSYLVIEDRDGEWIFAIPDLSQIELRSGLGPLQPLIAGPQSPAGGEIQDATDGVLPVWSAPGESNAADSTESVTAEVEWEQQSPAVRLREITKLYRSGLLTDAEYEAKRAELIEQL